MTTYYNFIQQFIVEASAYQDIEHIEKLAEAGSLHNVPLWPLAQACKGLNSDQFAAFLGQFSTEQTYGPAGYRPMAPG